MIQDPHIDKGECISQSNRNSPVCCARLRISAWVIVAEDYCCGIRSDRSPHYFPGVDRSSVDGSDSEPLDAENAMSIVKPDRVKFFVL
mgnify:CR=1 FL=1